MNNCYYCKDQISVMPPKVISYGVRDNKKLNVIQCAKCSLVYLDNHNHISDEHYENSGMHGNQMSSLDDWLNDTSIDDTRRFNQLYSLIKNANVVDVGCGNGGFLSKCIGHAKSIKGIELENRVINYWKDQIQIEKSFSNNDNNFDLFTAFHLLEHIKDPISFLSNIRKKMSDNSILVIEVPNYDDALIKTYKLKSFKKFTFWSQHVYYYSPTTLKNILRTSGFKVKKINQIQRYPLSNHLYWLCKGIPGGHNKWNFLNNTQISRTYEKLLQNLSQCDTLLGYFVKDGK